MQYSYIIIVIHANNSYFTYEFQVPQLPSLIDSVLYYISYNAEGSGSTNVRIYFPGSRRNSAVRLSYTLTSLKRDTEYTIQIRAAVEFSPCSTYVYGNYSDLVSFQTNATSEPLLILSACTRVTIVSSESVYICVSVYLHVNYQ